MENVTGAAWGDEPWKLDSREFTAYDFLHGYCDIFAEYLSNAFGYATESVYADAGNLVHSYCVIRKAGKPDLYADVRGVCSDRKLLLEEFEDFIKDPNTPLIKPGLPVLNADMTKEMHDTVLFFAQELVEVTGNCSYGESFPAAA